MTVRHKRKKITAYFIKNFCTQAKKSKNHIFIF